MNPGLAESVRGGLELRDTRSRSGSQVFFAATLQILVLQGFNKKPVPKWSGLFLLRESMAANSGFHVLLSLFSPQVPICRRQKMHEYSVVPVAEIPKLGCLVNVFLASHPDLRFHETECFKNAWKLMRISSKIGYVEGYCYIDAGGNKLVPFHHAWNVYDGLAFDFTSELLFNGNIGNGVNRYAEVIRTNSRTKARAMMQDRDMEASLLIRNSFPSTFLLSLE